MLCIESMVKHFNRKCKDKNKASNRGLKKSHKNIMNVVAVLVTNQMIIEDFRSLIAER